MARFVADATDGVMTIALTADVNAATAQHIILDATERFIIFPVGFVALCCIKIARGVGSRHLNNLFASIFRLAASCLPQIEDHQTRR